MYTRLPQELLLPTWRPLRQLVGICGMLGAMPIRLVVCVVIIAGPSAVQATDVPVIASDEVEDARLPGTFVIDICPGRTLWQLEISPHGAFKFSERACATISLTSGRWLCRSGQIFLVPDSDTMPTLPSSMRVLQLHQMAGEIFLVPLQEQDRFQAHVACLSSSALRRWYFHRSIEDTPSGAHPAGPHTERISAEPTRTAATGDAGQGCPPPQEELTPFVKVKNISGAGIAGRYRELRTEAVTLTLDIRENHVCMLSVGTALGLFT